MTSGPGVNGGHLSPLKAVHDGVRAPETDLRPSRLPPLEDEDTFTLWLVGGILFGLLLDAAAVWAGCKVWRRVCSRPR